MDGNLSGYLSLVLKCLFANPCGITMFETLEMVVDIFQLKSKLILSRFRAP